MPGGSGSSSEEDETFEVLRILDHCKKKIKRLAPSQDPDGRRTASHESWPQATYQFLVKWADKGSINDQYDSWEPYNMFGKASEGLIDYLIQHPRILNDDAVRERFRAAYNRELKARKAAGQALPSAQQKKGKGTDKAYLPPLESDSESSASSQAFDGADSDSSQAIELVRNTHSSSSKKKSASSSSKGKGKAKTTPAQSNTERPLKSVPKPKPKPRPSGAASSAKRPSEPQAPVASTSKSQLPSAQNTPRRTSTSTKGKKRLRIPSDTDSDSDVPLVKRPSLYKSATGQGQGQGKGKGKGQAFYSQRPGGTRPAQPDSARPGAKKPPPASQTSQATTYRATAPKVRPSTSMDMDNSFEQELFGGNEGGADFDPFDGAPPSTSNGNAHQRERSNSVSSEEFELFNLGSKKTPESSARPAAHSGPRAAALNPPPVPASNGQSLDNANLADQLSLSPDPAFWGGFDAGDHELSPDPEFYKDLDPPRPTSSQQQQQQQQKQGAKRKSSLFFNSDGTDDDSMERRSPSSHPPAASQTRKKLPGPYASEVPPSAERRQTSRPAPAPYREPSPIQTAPPEGEAASEDSHNALFDGPRQADGNTNAVLSGARVTLNWDVDQGSADLDFMQKQVASSQHFMNAFPSNFQKSKTRMEVHDHVNAFWQVDEKYGPVRTPGSSLTRLEEIISGRTAVIWAPRWSSAPKKDRDTSQDVLALQLLLLQRQASDVIGINKLRQAQMIFIHISELTEMHDLEALVDNKEFNRLRRGNPNIEFAIFGSRVVRGKNKTNVKYVPVFKRIWHLGCGITFTSSCLITHHAPFASLCRQTARWSSIVRIWLHRNAKILAQDSYYLNNVQSLLALHQSRANIGNARVEIVHPFLHPDPSEVLHDPSMKSPLWSLETDLSSEGFLDNPIIGLDPLDNTNEIATLQETSRRLMMTYLEVRHWYIVTSPLQFLKMPRGRSGSAFSDTDPIEICDIKRLSFLQKRYPEVPVYTDRPSKDISEGNANGGGSFEAPNADDNPEGGGWGAQGSSAAVSGTGWDSTEPSAADNSKSGGVGWGATTTSAQDKWDQPAPTSNWDAAEPNSGNVPDSTDDWAPADQVDSWETPAGANSVDEATTARGMHDAAETVTRRRPSLEDANIDPSLADLTNDDIYSADDTDLADGGLSHHEMQRPMERLSGTKSAQGSQPSWGQSTASTSAWGNEPAPTPWGDEPAVASVDSWDLPTSSAAISDGSWSMRPQSKRNESWGASGSADRPTGLPAPAPPSDWAAPVASSRSYEGYKAPRDAPGERGASTHGASALPARSIDERPQPGRSQDSGWSTAPRHRNRDSLPKRQEGREAPVAATAPTAPSWGAPSSLGSGWDAPGEQQSGTNDW